MSPQAQGGITPAKNNFTIRWLPVVPIEALNFLIGL
jgi:hypothetical protein